MRFLHIISFICFLTTGTNASAVSLCKDPVVSGSYQKSPNCVAGIPEKNTQMPFVAILEPVIDQSDQSDIYNANIRYIDLPVGQSFDWYLSDGDPESTAYIEIQPVLIESQSKMQFYFKNVLSAKTLLKLSQSIALASSCTGNILSGYTCDNLEDFFNTISPIAKAMGFSSTLAWLTGLDKPAMLTQTKDTVSGTKGVYLSLRYIQTCSGGLLASGQVLTAAHCYYDWDNDDQQWLWSSANLHKRYIIGNNWQTSNNIASSSALTPQSNNIAPGFLITKNQKATDIDLTKDYAIVTLDQSFDNISGFSITPMPISNQDNTYAAGFGMTEPFQSNIPPKNPLAQKQYYSSLSSAAALVTPATFIDSQTCLNDYSAIGQSLQEPSQLMCAGSIQEAALCAGDSGAPLYSIDDTTQKMILHGHFEGSPIQCTNSAPKKSNADEWGVLPGLYVPTNKLCTEESLENWINSLGIHCQ
ncbi:trypsin-like serine protease [Facilibium subflavum]|uniref:trypsin-like serine protease n=1 Tax=Facilibium subflavum TaxID=2219058 RepID=UPI000E65B84F|nr:trypsin-like serine protease [Facilibium subflavum]